MLKEAILESVSPEPIAILLEISGTLEHVTRARAALLAAGIQVRLIQQTEELEEEQEYL
jgi:hypothetical protein